MNDSIDALLASNHRLFQDGLIMARRLDELEPRVARLEGALREARDYVASELAREREAFKGHEHASDIASIEADLAKIDAALEQETKDV